MIAEETKQKTTKPHSRDAVRQAIEEARKNIQVPDDQAEAIWIKGPDGNLYNLGTGKKKPKDKALTHAEAKQIKTSPYVRAASRVFRNAKCNCGSGKKTKKCCLKGKV